MPARAPHASVAAIVGCGLIVSSACSPPASVLAADAPTSVPPYKQLRYDEDYRGLRDVENRTDCLDSLKYIGLDHQSTSYITIGGEVRERFEYVHNSQWGSGPQDDDGYLLQRYMLHTDLHVGEHVRVFAQLKSGLESGPSIEIRPGGGLLVVADWDFFWRQSTRDGLYGVAVNLVRSGKTSGERYIGNQVQIRWEWALQRHLTIAAIYAHFFAGPFIKESGPGKDVDYTSLWATFKF